MQAVLSVTHIHDYHIISVTELQDGIIIYFPGSAFRDDLYAIFIIFCAIICDIYHFTRYNKQSILNIGC